MSNDFFDGHNGTDWQDWMMIGPLSEEIANEKREQDRIQKELDDDFDDDYWDNINKKW